MTRRNSSSIYRLDSYYNALETSPTNSNKSIFGRFRSASRSRSFQNSTKAVESPRLSSQSTDTIHVDALFDVSFYKFFS